VMGRVALHRRGVACELFHEETASHAGDSILSAYLECGGLAAAFQAGPGL